MWCSCQKRKWRRTYVALEVSEKSMHFYFIIVCSFLYNHNWKRTLLKMLSLSDRPLLRCYLMRAFYFLSLCFCPTDLEIIIYYFEISVLPPRHLYKCNNCCMPFILLFYSGISSYLSCSITPWPSACLPTIHIRRVNTAYRYPPRIFFHQDNHHAPSIWIKHCSDFFRIFQGLQYPFLLFEHLMWLPFLTCIMIELTAYFLIACSLEHETHWMFSLVRNKFLHFSRRLIRIWYVDQVSKVDTKKLFCKI